MRRSPKTLDEVIAEHVLSGVVAAGEYACRVVKGSFCRITSDSAGFAAPCNWPGHSDINLQMYVQGHGKQQRPTQSSGWDYKQQIQVCLYL